jgi:HEPN domain-containing protein
MNAKQEFVRSWLTKSQHDLAAARKLSTGPDLYLDVAIYHCQQAAEKAVKGFLAFHDHPIERTHDIEVLVTLAMRYDAEFSTQLGAAALLTPYATEFRYPGNVLEPDPEEFRRWMQRTGYAPLCFPCCPQKYAHSAKACEWITPLIYCGFLFLPLILHSAVNKKWMRDRIWVT